MNKREHGQKNRSQLTVRDNARKEGLSFVIVCVMKSITPVEIITGEHEATVVCVIRISCPSIY